jgi:hypothetical protein
VPPPFSSGAARVFAGLFGGRFAPIQFAGRLSDDVPAAWAQDFDQTILRGNAFVAEAAFFHAGRARCS